MPVVDFVLNTLGIIENVFSAAIVSILTYMVFGGWKFVFRAISFFFDSQLVKLIGTTFTYFNKLLTMDMFNEKLMDELLRNIYIFIGVIMFFRLMMLIIKYLINPDLIGDAKAGVNSLIQRVVIGCCGILFLPTIFNLANELQVAILEDGIIQQLIIPRDMIDAMSEKINQGGHYIGTYVLAGFLSPNSSASDTDVKQFELGVQQGDLSNVDVNEGGFLTQKYKYDYFFFISTLALGYVFYYMLKYCIDIAGRCFKLLLYKLIAPIAMIEYIINGSQDGLFKQWLTASISTYCMLFVRILAIWFVLLVTTLMGDNSSGYAGALLTDNDYFLRAIIIIALLGFMMDLPKLVGQIFGLDLEQEGSASGVLKQVGGMVKGAAVAGLAVGGAAAAGGYSMAKGGLQNLQKAGNDAGGLRNLAKNTGKSIGEGIKNKANAFKNDPKGSLKNIAKSATPGNMMRKANEMSSKLNQSEFGQQSDRTGKAVFGAVMASNQFTKSAYGGYEEVRGEESKARAKELETQKHEEIVANQRTQIRNQDEAAYRDVIERITETEPAGTSKDVIQAKAMLQFFGNPAQMTAEVNGRLAAISNTRGNIETQDVVQNVQQVLSQKLDVSQNEITQVVNQVLANGGLLSTPAEVEQVVSRVVNQVQGSRASAEEQTINQVVNQVYGTRVNNSVDNATQVVSQKLDQQIDIQRNINDNISQSVDLQEQIQYDVHAQTNIQRNQVSMINEIRHNTEESNVWNELTAENTEQAKNSLDNIDRKTGGGGNNP